MLSFKRFALPLIIAAAMLTGCASIFNDPVNQISAGEPSLLTALPPMPGNNDLTIVGLGFSGGGTRAAAFAYGMLQELENTPVPGQRGSMLSLVRFISGVSGGSVTATYYGLKGPQGYGDLREKFLIRDGESTMKTSLGLGTFVRALQGGVNNNDTFGEWLDKHVYEGARFRDMWKPDRPVIWVNSTDIYNRAPFIFNRETFAALCSDLANLRVADAVAASAAVPVVFAPTVLETFGDDCSYELPGWITTAISDPSAPGALKAFARALKSYRDPDKMKFVKLVDGGVTDNFGVTGLTLARAQSRTPYGPFTAEQAIRVKRVIYLVADSSQDPVADWTETTKGPALVEMVMALTDTAINNSVREGYDAFRSTMRDWQNDLIEYRCKLPDEAVLKVRKTLDGWNCRDVKFFLSDVNAEDLAPARRAPFQKIPTRLKLPVEQVDLAIAAGREAVRNDPTFRGALRSLAGIDVDDDRLDQMQPTDRTLTPTRPAEESPSPETPSVKAPDTAPSVTGTASGTSPSPQESPAPALTTPPPPAATTPVPAAPASLSTAPRQAANEPEAAGIPATQAQ